MNVEIKVIVRAKRDLVKREQSPWKIYTCAPAVDGRANQAVIRLLAQELNVRQSQIRIIKGLKSRVKTISIEGI